MYKLKLWLILLLGEKDKENNFFWYKRKKLKGLIFRLALIKSPFSLR